MNMGGVVVVARWVEVVALPPLVLGVLPLVERFIDDVETERVAQPVELGRMRIMRHADAVAAHALEFEQPAQPHLVGGGGAEGTGILVQAHALEDASLAIDEETAIDVEAEGTD